MEFSAHLEDWELAQPFRPGAAWQRGKIALQLRMGDPDPDHDPPTAFTAAHSGRILGRWL